MADEITPAAELAEDERIVRGWAWAGPHLDGLLAEYDRRGAELERLRARVAELGGEVGRLETFQNAAHGLICNAHSKRVDYVTNDDGASPGWAEAARAWIDAYPFGTRPWPEVSS